MKLIVRCRVLAAVLAVSLSSACSDPSPDILIDSNSRPVKVIKLAGANGDRSGRYPAVIDAGERAELSFLVGGVVLEVPVSESTDVEAGDLIARLDPRDFESNVASAQASFANAEEEYQRAVRLAEQDAIAKNVLEQREAQRDVAQAQLDSAQKALEDSVLRAPFAGVVASLPVRAQQTVSPGTQVATVIDVKSLEATVNVPARIIAGVPTQGDYGAFVLLEAAPGREIPAVFLDADLVADATSQTYSVTFTFDSPEDVLVLPGMNATLVVSSAGDQPAVESVSVPLAAVQSDGQGQYVWVVDPDAMTVSRRGIEVAPGIGESVVATTGLSLGEQIVGAGGAYLSEGMEITPWTD